MSHPERIDPTTTEAGILAVHLKRYDFGRNYCTDADVLDAACGAGYGSAYLATVARRVVGIDTNANVVGRATSLYSRPNIEFRVGDVETLDDADESYDVICSFETIEHIENPEHALAEFARVLRTTGTLVISTPNVPATTSTPANPFHVIEWSATDFLALLNGFFADVELWGQQRVQTRAHHLAQRLDVLGLRKRFGILRHGARLLGTAPTADLTLADVVIERDRLKGATELVAVCRRPRR